MDVTARTGGSGADPIRVPDHGIGWDAPSPAAAPHGVQADAPAFTIVVDIERGSLASFAEAGAALYALPAFGSSNDTAVPLIVAAVRPLSRSNALRWDGVLGAFASYDDLATGVTTPGRRTIFAGNEEPVRAGDTVSLGPSLQLVAKPAANAGAVTFRTEEPGRFTCGLVFGRGSRLGCAATLTASLDVTFAPASAIFLMFSTSAFELRAWVARSTSPGLLVDMTGSDTRRVTFDQRAPGGWMEADQAWARAVPAGTSLSDVLCQAPQTNEPW